MQKSVIAADTSFFGCKTHITMIQTDRRQQHQRRKTDEIARVQKRNEMKIETMVNNVKRK